MLVVQEIVQEIDYLSKPKSVNKQLNPKGRMELFPSGLSPRNGLHGTYTYAVFE